MNYCSHCGGRLVSRIPDDDDHLRRVCPACSRVHYQNPTLVVGCIPLWQDRALEEGRPRQESRILLCKRAIEPRLGYWTLPAGYLEYGETVAQGAARETLEETGANVVDLAPYRMYDIVHVHQVYLLFRARLKAPNFHPTKESSAVELFSESQIPWDEIAFPVIRKTLEDYLLDRLTGCFPFTNGEITTRLK
jgi:ADP-ribose pyrophosphatase YjhB (NUDIX family)